MYCTVTPSSSARKHLGSAFKWHLNTTHWHLNTTHMQCRITAGLAAPPPFSWKRDFNLNETFSWINLLPVYQQQRCTTALGKAFCLIQYKEIVNNNFGNWFAKWFVSQTAQKATKYHKNTVNNHFYHQLIRRLIGDVHLTSEQQRQFTASKTLSRFDGRWRRIIFIKMSGNSFHL